MKKAVVTGANGFLGTALCRELSSQGMHVIAVVKRNAYVETIKGLERIKMIDCDITEYEKLSKYISDRDIDVIYHLAWTGTSGMLRSDYHKQLENVKGSCDLVKACADMGCRRFVFAASIMEYEVDAFMRTEGAPMIDTIYSSSKLAADYMIRAIAADLEIDYIKAVISNIYGPGEVSSRLINTNLRKLLNGEHCSFSNGEQKYDFIYIDDAARAFYALGARGIANRTYYIGNQVPRKLKDFLYTMRDQVNPAIEIGIGELPSQGITLTYREFDMSAIERDTGFCPTTSFADGIRKTIEWIGNSGNE